MSWRKATGYSIQRLLYRFMGMSQPSNQLQRANNSKISGFSTIARYLTFPFKLSYAVAEQQVDINLGANCNWTRKKLGESLKFSRSPLPFPQQLLKTLRTSWRTATLPSCSQQFP